MKACVFDAYGTLLDLGSAVAPHAAVLGEAAAPLLALWRRKQLEYTWLRTLMGRHADFETITRDALAYALEALGLRAPNLEPQLGRAFRMLDAYPDAVATLTRIRAAGIRTAVLSNGNPDMLGEAFVRAGLTALLDQVISVQPLGVYKPSPPVYAMAAEVLGLPPAEIAFVSGNAWDAAGGANAGLHVVLIEAPGTPAERLPAASMARVRALAEVPGVLGVH